MKATLLGVIGLICVATTAQAQITGLNHLWTVAGVMQTAAGIGTYIACSNLNSGSETVGINIYGPGGAYVAPSGIDSITVAPGATVIFGTTAAAGISVDVNYVPGAVSKGMVHVLSSATKGIVCSAYLADSTASLPTSMVSLTIAKKTKQKGD